MFRNELADLTQTKEKMYYYHSPLILRCKREEES